MVIELLRRISRYEQVRRRHVVTALLSNICSTSASHSTLEDGIDIILCLKMCRRRLWLLYYGNDEAKLHLNQAQFCVHLTGGVFVVHFKICQIQPSMELSENESA